jgi:hypothetical protein
MVSYPPIITVGHPGGNTLPTGDGIGATQLTWLVMSLMRAAGMLPIRTVIDPNAIIPGPAGTQPGRVHGVVVSVARAAGILPIRQVGIPVIMGKGRAGCALGAGPGAGGWMGAWQCGASWRTISPILAAGGM